MTRKKPKRRLVDACFKHVLVKKVVEALNSSSGSDSSSSDDDPIMNTLLEVTRKRYLKLRHPIAKTPAMVLPYMHGSCREIAPRRVFTPRPLYKCSEDGISITCMNSDEYE